MKILVDMNLFPDWIPIFDSMGFEAAHWSQVGDVRASDSTLFDWGAKNGHIVFTHDLDFGAILAATGSKSPSVIQLKTQDPSPRRNKELVSAALRQFSDHLTSGALVAIDPEKIRVRILPI